MTNNKFIVRINVKKSSHVKHNEDDNEDVNDNVDGDGLYFPVLYSCENSK